MRGPTIFGLATAAVIIGSGGGIVRAETVVESSTYTMSDNDTRPTARKACVAQASYKAVIGSGSLVGSDLEMVKTDTSQESRHRVYSLTAGIVQTSIKKETWTDAGITCEVSVTFNPAEIKEKLYQAWQKQREDALVESAADTEQDEVIHHMDEMKKKLMRLRVGMSYEQVVKYMGGKPDREHDNQWCDWYQWGGFGWVGFQNGYVYCVYDRTTCAGSWI